MKKIILPLSLLAVAACGNDESSPYQYPHMGHELVLERGAVDIERSPNSDIIIDDDKVATLPERSNTLGKFWDFRFYQSARVFGFEQIKSPSPDTSGKIIDWSFKVYISENNSFDIEYMLNLVPEYPSGKSEYWSWESGTWHRVGNYIILEGVGIFAEDEGTGSLTFYDGLPSLKEYRPDLNEELELWSETFQLKFNRGYLQK